MIDRIKAWLRKSYGVDLITKHMYYVTLVLLIVNIFVRNAVIKWIALIFIAIIIYRTLSHQIIARSREGNKYRDFVNKMRRRFTIIRRNFKDKEYKHFICEKCGTQLRVPKKRGQIEVTCPKCKTKFDAKT